MGGTQTITVQHSQAVVSHVPDRVRMSIEVDNAGPAGVPMIEPDHLNPTLDKPADQCVRATDTLSSRPHDHQNSGKPRFSDPLSPNPQRTGGHKSLVRIQHGGTVAATCRRTPTFTVGPAENSVGCRAPPTVCEEGFMTMAGQPRSKRTLTIKVRPVAPMPEYLRRPGT
jgi:hypothetical protein